jgi:hypothetical protein
MVSSNGEARFRIRTDRDTRNLSTLSLGSGTTRIIQRSGASAGTQLNFAYSSFTADSSTVTIVGTGLTTESAQIASGTLVDIVTPKVDNIFFVPDLRGRTPFGELSALGVARGENFNLGLTGATGASASGQGGLFTNYIIRARRESDALILTGHNHDSRYLRKDVSDSVTPGISTILANTIVSGSLNAASGLVVTGGARIAGGITSSNNINILGANGLLFNDSDNSNWLQLKAPSVVAGNVTWTLPSTDGTAGFVLQTNASGTLSWKETLAGSDMQVQYNQNGVIGATGNLLFHYNGAGGYSAGTLGVSGGAYVLGNMGIGITGQNIGGRILQGSGANTARGKLEVVGDIRIPSGGFFVNSNITIPSGLTATIANGENALMAGTLTVESGATLLVQTGGTIIVL